MEKNIHKMVWKKHEWMLWPTQYNSTRSAKEEVSLRKPQSSTDFCLRRDTDGSQAMPMQVISESQEDCPQERGLCLVGHSAVSILSANTYHMPSTL